jgi:uncharacterized protein
MKALNLIAAVLVIVGALNWGLVGLAQFDLVHALLGATILSTIVYTLVGVAGLYQVLNLTGATSSRPARA